MVWFLKNEQLFLCIWVCLSLGYITFVYYYETDRIRSWLKINWDWEFVKKRWYDSSIFLGLFSGIAIAVFFSMVICYYQLFLKTVLVVLSSTIIYFGILVVTTARLEGNDYGKLNGLCRNLLLSTIKLIPIISLFILLTLIVKR